jgi:hypothetical protein
MIPAVYPGGGIEPARWLIKRLFAHDIESIDEDDLPFAASYAKRRMVRSRLESNARSAVPMRLEPVAVTISPVRS